VPVPGAAVMIPQVLSLIQRTFTAPGTRARAMSMYAAVLSGGAILGQVVGGLLVSADLFGTTWRHPRGCPRPLPE
jgi:MFS family permease